VFPRPLAALLGAATVLSIAWALFTPPLSGPDESGHAAYVQQLAQTGHGPDVGITDGKPVSSEMQALIDWRNLDSVVGVSTARPGWSDAEHAAWERAARDADRGDGDGPNPLAQNPPLYYVYDAVAYDLGRSGSLTTRLLLMRLANLPLLWLVVCCGWLAIGEVFRRSGTFARTVGTGAIALLPMLTFMSGVINPDIALAAATTAAIALSLTALRVGPRPLLLLGLVALGAAGVLIHGRGLALLPPIVLVILMVLWRGRHAPGGRRRVAVGAGAVVVMGLGLIAAIAYSNGHAGGTSLSGELTGSSSSGLNDLSGLFDYVWQFYFSPLTGQQPPPADVVLGYRQIFVEQFLGGEFGSLEVHFSDTIYSLLKIAQGAGLIALIAVLARRWDRVRAHAAQGIVLLGFVVSTLVLLHVAAWQDLSESHASLLAGRYLLPLVSVFAIAVTAVVVSVPPRARVVLGSAVLASGAGLSVGAVVLTAVRFYA
jgi:4-amino-4-deoxy-L-arabinose transferase-like glycosyltransferase